jgi:hypothetical protein
LSLDKEVATAWIEQLSRVKVDEVCILSQPSYQVHYPGEAPDMKLLSDELVVICEHKISARLGERQLERYLELVKIEETRTGRPHRLALITRQLLNLPQYIIQDPYYLKPAGAPHFRWQDFYNLLENLTGPASKGAPTLIELRKQFMEFLRSLGLSAVPLPEGFIPLSRENTLAEKELQRAFGEQWHITRSWLVEKGFTCHAGSRIQLYIWPQASSEIPESSPLDHIIAEPGEGDDLPYNSLVDRPVLEVNIVLNQGNERLAEELCGRDKARISSLDLPMVVWQSRMPKKRICVRYALPLEPILRSDSPPASLSEIVKEIYTEYILPVFQRDRDPDNVLAI